ncbi:LOW QUALITY PROTEIN: transferrin-a [Garra rufa]|uniref:LOW QUALITY PROTEIN: transferrin-a n=1 Tax=Garra rufa TaxID=137080 RepID=UPI003CCEF807
MNILLFSLLGFLVVVLPSASAQKVIWCVTPICLAKCQHLATKSPDLECLVKPSVTECMWSIRDGDADAITVDGEHIYQAGLRPYDLRPVITEISKKRCCYAVAVVKKDTDFTINDLKGKTSCHSCYKKPGGWNIPIGRLVAQNKISWDGPDDRMPLEKAVSQFFSSSCVPGISKAQYPNLCQACKGDCSCSQNEKYFGDEGALQCLNNGHGQVAFVCQDAIPSNEKQNYLLLCMNGSRKSVDDYKDCYLAKEPPRAVISRKHADSQHIYKVLKQIPVCQFKLMFCVILSQSGNGPMLKILDRSMISKEADAIAVDGGQVYIAGKCGLVPVMVEQYDQQSCDAGEANQNSPCFKELKHLKWKTAKLQSTPLTNRLLSTIVRVGANIIIVVVVFIVIVLCANRSLKLISVMCTDASSYYVVAVVRKGSGVTWKNLRGRKSCHTGLNTDAGWYVPDSAICDRKQHCTLHTFFSKGCLPGADPHSKMCELCKGSGKAVGDKNKCKASSGEKYYGYDGAFRCLAENNEVAFIRHTIVEDYTDGKGPDWAKDLKSADFELICPITRQTVKHPEYLDCHLAIVPAHAVVTREDTRADVVNVLKEAQANSEVPLFKSEGKRNLIFTDSTKCLQENTKPLVGFLTQLHIDMIERTYVSGQAEPDLVKACTRVDCPGPPHAQQHHHQHQHQHHQLHTKK